MDIVRKLKNKMYDLKNMLRLKTEHVTLSVGVVADAVNEIERLREERDKLKDVLRSIIALTALKLEEKE